MRRITLTKTNDEEIDIHVDGGWAATIEHDNNAFLGAKPNGLPRFGPGWMLSTSTEIAQARNELFPVAFRTADDAVEAFKKHVNPRT